MDEFFELFLSKMGPAADRRYVPASSIDRYRRALPQQLLAYWETYGWCSYGDGSFWTVDPGEYEPVLEAWIGETSFMENDAYHIIARSAFGHLYLWGEKSGLSLTLVAPGSFCVPSCDTRAPDDLGLNLKIFFATLERCSVDFADLFSPALKSLGKLAHDEMYGFVPALALGGSSELSNLQKVRAVEHLVFLAQLAPLEILPAPC